MQGDPVVIAVVNHKGGTAKTTTAVNLAAALSKGDSEMGIKPKRVLLVDLDPRGNVATTFGIDNIPPFLKHLSHPNIIYMMVFNLNHRR